MTFEEDEERQREMLREAMRRSRELGMEAESFTDPDQAKPLRLAFVGDDDSDHLRHLHPARSLGPTMLLSMVAATGMLAGLDDMAAIGAQIRRGDAPERGTFANGDEHPDMCHCGKCIAWRKSRRTRSNRSGR